MNVTEYLKYNPAVALTALHLKAQYGAPVARRYVRVCMQPAKHERSVNRVLSKQAAGYCPHTGTPNEAIYNLIRKAGQSGINVADLCAATGLERHVVQKSVTQLKRREVVKVCCIQGEILCLLSEYYSSDQDQSNRARMEKALTEYRQAGKLFTTKEFLAKAGVSRSLLNGYYKDIAEQIRELKQELKA